jgi:hypothetical protein
VQFRGLAVTDDEHGGICLFGGCEGDVEIFHVAEI